MVDDSPAALQSDDAAGTVPVPGVVAVPGAGIGVGVGVAGSALAAGMDAIAQAIPAAATPMAVRRTKLTGVPLLGAQHLTLYSHLQNNSSSTPQTLRRNRLGRGAFGLLPLDLQRDVDQLVLLTADEFALPGPMEQLVRRHVITLRLANRMLQET